MRQTIWYQDVINLGFKINQQFDSVYEAQYGFSYQIISLECPKGIVFYYERENPYQVKILRCKKNGDILSSATIKKLDELKKWVKFFKKK